MQSDPRCCTRMRSYAGLCGSCGFWEAVVGCGSCFVQQVRALWRVCSLVTGGVASTGLQSGRPGVGAVVGVRVGKGCKPLREPYAVCSRCQASDRFDWLVCAKQGWGVGWGAYVSWVVGLGQWRLLQLPSTVSGRLWVVC